MASSEPQHTLLGMVFPSSLGERPWRQKLQLTIEALLSTVVSVYVTVTLGVEEAGLVSLFLVAAALSNRVAQLLEENRRNIWERGLGGWRTNRATAGAILALIGGVFAGYALVAYAFGEARVASLFGFALRAAALGGESLLERDFGTFPALLAHNGGVLLVIACLAFVYRAYGTMLALAWNACIWALVITTLAVRGASSSGVSPVRAIAVATATLAPHLLLEGVAYITVSLAFLFASKGLTTYPANDARLRRVLGASAMLTLAACVALVLAAAVEVALPPLARSLM
jgi:hypothetical protein